MTTATQDTNVIEQAGMEALDQVERLFEEAVSERRQLSEGELAQLRRLGFDVTGYRGREKALSIEWRRVSRKLQLRERAGTPQRRGQLRKKADDAREAAESRLPEIEQAIAELEREKQQLEKSRDESEQQARDAEQAAQALRDVNLLPRHRQKQANEARNAVKARHEPVLKAARDAVSAAETCTKLRPDQDWYRHGPDALRYCERHLPSAIITEQKGNAVHRTIDAATWAKHQQQQREALPELRERLAQVEAALQEGLEGALAGGFA